jgi:antibiotic biosynthesis monooxygenase (ABM) superfamily enzyme
MKSKARLIAALKIWLVIYPSITLFQALFGEQLAALHLYQRTFLLTIVLVPWVVFAGLPALEFLNRAMSSGATKKHSL